MRNLFPHYFLLNSLSKCLLLSSLILVFYCPYKGTVNLSKLENQGVLWYTNFVIIKNHERKRKTMKDLYVVEKDGKYMQAIDYDSPPESFGPLESAYFYDSLSKAKRKAEKMAARTRNKVEGVTVVPVGMRKVAEENIKDYIKKGCPSWNDRCRCWLSSELGYFKSDFIMPDFCVETDDYLFFDCHVESWFGKKGKWFEAPCEIMRELRFRQFCLKNNPNYTPAKYIKAYGDEKLAREKFQWAKDFLWGRKATIEVWELYVL